MLAGSSELYYLIKGDEWRRCINSAEERRGLPKGFFDGDRNALLPSFTNTDVERLEYVGGFLNEFGIRASQIPPQMRKGIRGYRNEKSMWIIRRRDAYATFIHPDNYLRFLEIIGTSIEGERDLIEFLIKRIKHYTIECGIRSDLLMTCMKLQKEAGRNLKMEKRSDKNPLNS